MFNITKYLQYRNTPDGKPRVLVEGVDYKMKTATQLLDGNVGILPCQEWIAQLSDCRPLLTYHEDWYGTINTRFGDLAMVDSKYCNDGIIIIEREKACIHYTETAGFVKTSYTEFNERGEGFHIEGFFYEDPAKYSKLLWNCSEEEGWQKVFKLLGIEL